MLYSWVTRGIESAIDEGISAIAEMAMTTQDIHPRYSPFRLASS